MWDPGVEQFFSDGAKHRWPGGRMSTIEVVRVGDVRLPTGKLVVCDPGWLTRRFTGQVAADLAPGSYPVELSVVHLPRANPRLPTKRVTAARVLVSSERVDAWEPAWPPKDADRGTAGGFAVDGGQGCFTDLATSPFLAEYLGDRARSGAVISSVLDHQWAIVEDEETAGNMVVFDCGMGDGDYAVWVGRAADGAIAQVAADLELLWHSEGPFSGSRRSR